MLKKILSQLNANVNVDSKLMQVDNLNLFFKFNFYYQIAQAKNQLQQREKKLYFVYTSDLEFERN